VFAVIGIGLACLALASGCNVEASAQSDRASTPRIAQIGGVHIGYSTQEELESAWGEGLTTVGSHPNSGRRWRVRGTNWIIATDGFLYSDRGLVIDALTLGPIEAESPSEDAEAPFATLNKKAFAWLGEISQGMTKTEVIAVLHRQAITFKEEGEILWVNADGFSAITSEPSADFHHWGASLQFKDGKLSCLQLAADR